MTARKRVLRGAKGGGSSSSAASVEASDSLHSKQFARILDLVSEGPIVGLVNGAKSVYLNDVPLQNADNTYNFKDFGLNWTTGTQTQLTTAAGQAAAAQFGFDAVRYDTAVNVEVVKLTPIVRTVSNANVNSLVVTLSVQSLLSRDPTNGNTNPSSVDILIDVQSAAAGYVNKVTDTINGKTTSKYQRAYNIPVSGPGPWDVRVTRVTADSATQNLENKTFFDSVTGVIAHKLTYPNSALVASSIDSQQFQSIPTRGFDIKGLIVQIPTNYDPTTRVYTGAWDGTFKLAWTDNPAWCYYDMITNSRYGLGDYISPSQVDKWGLYTIAQYCDVLVPTGYGSATEPRFTCNLYLQSPAEAYVVMQNMASIFRAITFWATASITVVQDSPTNPIAQFTNANVIDGAFNYQGVSIKARHTVAQVSWNDPADLYRQKIEFVQDDDGVKLYGVKRADLVAFGCTSRGQANRLGKWLLYSDKSESETVTFRAGLDSLQVYPGAIIKTSDANRAGARMGGRIVAAATTAATLDSAVTIAAGKTYTLSIFQPDGTLVKAAVTAAVGAQTVLTFSTALAIAPQVNSVFVFEANDLVSETWRVIAVTEVEHHIAEINAIKHDPTKFAQIELGQKFDAPLVSAITTRPSAPTQLSVRTSPYQVAGAVVGLRATLSWLSRESTFRVRWRQASGIWNERQVNETTLDIDNIDYTTYEFQVYAISVLGRESDAAILNQAITVPAAILPALAGLALEGAFTSKTCKIKWDATPGATAYQVVVKDTATLTTRRTVNVGAALRFDYTSADMRADGGPWRGLTFNLTPLGTFSSASAAAGVLAVTNPQIGAVNGVNVTGGLKTIFATYATPADTDFVGVQVWLSTAAVFTPDATTLVYDGNDSLLVFRTLADGTTALVGATTYYMKIAAYDDFGKDSLTYSGSIAVTPSAFAPDANSITAAMLQAGILDTTKFASSIEPVTLVTAVPVAKSTSTVFNSTDGKLYRWNGTAYVATVPTTDLAGTVTDAQVAGLAAAKVTGQLTDTQIAAVAAAKVTGQLADTQIAGVAASKVTGTLSDTQIAAIAAAKVTGQITTTQITNNAISTAKLAAGAVTANEIAANTITAAKIASATITATELAAGSVTTAKLVAGAVTANEIAANTITARNLILYNKSSADPDPGFYDSTFWSAGNPWPAFVGPVASDTYPVSRVLLFQAGANVNMQSRTFVVEKNSKYRVKVILWKDPGTAGSFTTVLHIPGVIYHELNIPRAATSVAGYATDINWAAIPASQWNIYENVITSGGSYDWLQIITKGAITAGNMYIAIQITQMAGASLIVDGSIIAGKIAAGTVTATELSAGSVTTAKLVAGAVTANELAAGSIVAGKIAAGVITATEVAADAIAAGKIAAGAISAREIAAGAITTAKLAIIGSGAALNPDPNCADATAWNNTGGATWGTVTDGATGNNVIRSSTTIAAGAIASIRFAISAGKTYRANCKIRSSGGAKTAYFRVFRFPASGAYIAYNLGYEANSVPVGPGWTVWSATFTAEAGTAMGSVEFDLNWTGAADANYVEVQDVRVEEVLPGTLIADGAITTQKMTAASINGDRITANTLNADRIVSNSITTAKLIVGSVGTSAQVAFTNGPVAGFSTPLSLTMANAGTGKVIVLVTGTISAPAAGKTLRINSKILLNNAGAGSEFNTSHLLQSNPGYSGFVPVVIAIAFAVPAGTNTYALTNTCEYPAAVTVSAEDTYFNGSMAVYEIKV